MLWRPTAVLAAKLISGDAGKGEWGALVEREPSSIALFYIVMHCIKQLYFDVLPWTILLKSGP